MTDKLLRKLKQDVKSLSLSPFADGRFEVYVDGKRLHSKLESKQFPDEDALVDQIVALTGRSAQASTKGN